jgi:hypothetical protein
MNSGGIPPAPPDAVSTVPVIAAGVYPGISQNLPWGGLERVGAGVSGGKRAAVIRGAGGRALLSPVETFSSQGKGPLFPGYTRIVRTGTGGEYIRGRGNFPSRFRLTTNLLGSMPVWYLIMLLLGEAFEPLLWVAIMKREVRPPAHTAFFHRTGNCRRGVSRHFSTP